jgi:hypothetical protein
MQTHMTLQDLVNQVNDESKAKRDFVTSTKDNIRMVQLPGSSELSIVLLKDGSETLEQFGITDNAHGQIATRLGIPKKYYDRLLVDHPDMIMQQVNQLFEREPASRMIRVLGDNVRAFLSDRYRALDNDEVLVSTLPTLFGNDGGPTLETQILGGNITENHMNLKVLFTGDEMKREITRNTRTSAPRIISPGFRLTNSETGNGALKFQGFFFDSYCTNGCVFGIQELFGFSRNHLGSKLVEGSDFQIVSDETRKLQDQTIVAEIRDGIRAMASTEFVDEMSAKLIAAANTEKAINPTAAVDLAVKELGIRESERESVLETFLQDGDYSQWGLASAVTSVANDDKVVTLDRVNEIEDIGAQILNLSMAKWNNYAMAA